jgi:hypothetical protein
MGSESESFGDVTKNYHQAKKESHKIFKDVWFF